MYGGIREVARRIDVGTALVHLGGVRFPITGPIRYTMRARHVAALCDLLAPPDHDPGPLRGLVPLQGAPLVSADRTDAIRTGQRAPH